MSTTYRTCTHTYDNGGTCNSAAVTGQNYCTYHLRHRARLMRMAQARARNQRFELKLPPLESMHAVQSALNQLVEAVAADMLDLKRAHFLLTAVRLAAKTLMSAEKWPAPVFRLPLRPSCIAGRRRRVRPPARPRPRHPSRTRLPPARA